MSLQLMFRATTRLPIDLGGLTPEWARDKRLAEIERWQAQVGRDRVPLAELFAVRGDPADGQIELTGDMPNVHSICAGMAEGIARVEGNVGRHAGAEMCGGQLVVTGSAGDWLGREMHGGRIQVHGAAGDFAGGTPGGTPRGVTGGEIFIDGSAGMEIGRAMRRGLIVVGGAAGDSVGLNLLAGTILVFGPSGPRPGIGMRRGTIGLFTESAEIPLTFRRASRGRPQFMRLLLNYLRQAGLSAAVPFLDSEYVSYDGDLLSLGRGEILVRATS
jgi:formylmethanofuran dehydrogenase subunit C